MPCIAHTGHPVPVDVVDDFDKKGGLSTVDAALAGEVHAFPPEDGVLALKLAH